MATPGDNRIGLLEMIRHLREELIEATAEAQGEDITFKLGNIELDLQVVATRGHEVGGRAKTSMKFWVLNGEAGLDGKHKADHQHTQRLKLTLTPHDERRHGGETVIHGSDDPAAKPWKATP